MKQVIVLGAGMVGRAMAIDLSTRYSVTVADIDQNSLDSLLDYSILPIKSDLSSSQTISELIQGKDLVIGAVPGFMGFKTLETVIQNEKNIVDISFFNEDPFILDELAKKKNVTAVMDCGVAPGMSNLILGHYSQQMNIDEFVCYVGGLPKKRVYPYQYKAPFSPVDVIEEYIRPARYVQSGQLVVREALSDSEFINFDTVGTLEAFNTDGLRSLIQTMTIPNMKEKTLRFPGHIDIMRILRNSGFFSTEEIDIKQSKVRPIDLSSKLLFDDWKLRENDDEFTVMKIIIRGNQKEIQFDLYDERDKLSGLSSMARTTGFTATAVATALLEDRFNAKGIFPPELLTKAAPDLLDFIFEYLAERKVNYQQKII